MSRNLGNTELRINKATLWINAEMYQLRNIARVRPLELHPDKRPVSRRIKSLVITVAVGLPIICCSGQGGDSGIGVAALLGIAVTAIAGWHIYKLIELSKRQTQYALVIETTGKPQAGLVSFDFKLIDKLVDLIADAIENPPAREIIKHINNQKLVFGDEINMGTSDIAIGKAVASA